MYKTTNNAWKTINIISCATYYLLKYFKNNFNFFLFPYDFVCCWYFHFS